MWRLPFEASRNRAHIYAYQGLGEQHQIGFLSEKYKAPIFLMGATITPTVLMSGLLLGRGFEWLHGSIFRCPDL